MALAARNVAFPLRTAASLTLLGALVHGTAALANAPQTSPSAARSQSVNHERGSKAPATARQSQPAPARRSTAALMTATTAAPGQAGYVHYFAIRRPGEEWESQIGIELPDQAIAWAFPGAGVVVSPFMGTGSLAANGTLYEVEHRFAIRPFPDDEAMRVLRRELMPRVMPWVADATLHCEWKPAPGELCVSCLGFVLRVLFPGHFPDAPAPPRDFKRAAGNAYFTTEDLLLYLAGMQELATQEARFKRIEALALPDGLREELTRLAGAVDPASEIEATDAGVPARAAAKAKPGARTLSRAEQQRLRPRRKL